MEVDEYIRNRIDQRTKGHFQHKTKEDKNDENIVVIDEYMKKEDNVLINYNYFLNIDRDYGIKITISIKENNNELNHL